MTTTDCGCGCGGACQGVQVETPVTIDNPPGLAELAVRSGTHGEFLESMLARLSSPGYPALAGLTVRTTDDAAIALLDGWATVADLLTFYTERIANEGYLRTATRQESLRLLGNLVGHRPRPGVSAGTFLAYTVDKDPSSGPDTAVVIPKGTRAQSIPAQGEQAQSFEIGEDLPARWSWNDLQVRLRRPYQVDFDNLGNGGRIHVAGTANDIKLGNRLLFVFGTEAGRQVTQTVPSVEIDQATGVTVVGLRGPAQPKFKELVADFRALVSDAHGEMYNRSRIVRRYVDEVLTPLADALPKDPPATPPPTVTTPTEFRRRLAEAVERLHETEVLAEQYHNVHEYLVGTLEPALLDIVAAVVKLEPPQQQDNQPSSLFAELPADTSAAVGLGALLGALRTPPAQLPATPRDLGRDPRQVFASGSDAAVQLLSALDSRLRDSLYPAWRNVDLAAPLELQELQVMRTVATPFGATAPLKPLFDAQGRPAGSEDWPLRGTQTLDIQVTYNSNGQPIGTVFTWTETGENLVIPLEPFAEVEDFVIGPGKVTVTFQHPPPPPPDDGGDGGDGGDGEGDLADAPDPNSITSVTFDFDQRLFKRTVVVTSAKTNEMTAVTVRHGDAPNPPVFGLWVGSVVPGGQEELLLLASRSPKDGGSVVELNLRSALPAVSLNVLALDAVYDGIGPGSWVVIERSKTGDITRVITRVQDSRVVSRSDYGITGKVTVLSLEDDWLDATDTTLTDIRDTTVYTRGLPLALATEPVLDEVAGKQIELAQLYQGLTAGRRLVVTGERTDIPGTPGVPGTELTMISAVEQFVDRTRPGDTVHTRITLAADLAYRYRRDTVHLFANVGAATNGASRDEPIGSGDASKRNQTFTLFQSPVTWLAADTPLGAASTLEVRVDGVLWSEVDSLAGHGPAERVYTTAVDAAGAVAVTFGDGVNGARLTTGTQNVRAAYRVGVGKAANVSAGKISQLITRPLGVSGVNNPLPATGGADADGPEQARRTIPLSVTALDRLVSVPDYEDFARARAGIGRASARRLTDGTRQVVHVTVAGVDDIPLTDTSGIVTTLRSALAGFGDPQLPVRVAVRELVLLVLAANIRVSTAYSWALVEPAVRAALLDRLGFDRRELGRPAFLSEAIAAAQSVPGVEYVDIDVFAGVEGSLTPAGLDALGSTLTTPKPTVPARLAKFDVTRYTVQDTTETLTSIAAVNGIPVSELFRLNPDLTSADPLPKGRKVVVFRGIRPAQLALLSPDLPDTLILKEVRP
ncbi:putative baseplate assembly protein [Amycolatopsis mongoliensis]|uniref:Baseplate assembly protein n=1 Tax=Amycolatopsis mongoliensis TaxID=715475 RepID=A0A9Y2JLS2_9PSEU|nr:putative baseplate assembly protein [Amycolatopsis sp. 4-36]WIX99178.1 putative baseplate assembly protein [Amycolatopsis sp. 4-36]